MSTRQKLIERLAAVVSQVEGTKLLRTFIDEAYGRTGFTIASLGCAMPLSDPTLVGSDHFQGADTQTGSVATQLAASWESRTGLAPAVTELVKESLRSIDLSSHRASHPRLGVIDHIAFHPLGCSASTAPFQSTCTAMRVLRAIHLRACAEPWATFGAKGRARGRYAAQATLVCVYGGSKRAWRLFAAPASPGQGAACAKRLASLHLQGLAEETKGAAAGAEGRGATDRDAARASPVHVAYGPKEATEREGAIVIGAVPWVVNYNVPLQTSDLAVGRKVSRRSTAHAGQGRSVRATGRLGGSTTSSLLLWQIARAVSERRGGLPGVEAMALRHGNAEIEVACNLRDVSKTSTDALEKEIQRLSAAEGVRFGPGYATGVEAADALLSLHSLRTERQ
eukprot:scaffold1911_cov397-Prasinococcus_capsulatus_cf.AAC.17